MQEGEKKIKKCHRRGRGHFLIQNSEFRIQNYCACGRIRSFSGGDGNGKMTEGIMGEAQMNN